MKAEGGCQESREPEEFHEKDTHIRTGNYFFLLYLINVFSPSQTGLYA